MKGSDDSSASDCYEYLREFRQFLSWRRGDAILLAEANVPTDEIPEYFGNGTRMHMLFNFLVNQHLFLALARGDSRPLENVLRKIPDIPEEGQWANFLRNHDELDLGRLSEFDRGDVFERFAPDEDMQVYGRGIRRRLPPMMEGDESHMRLAYSLLFTLPGSPVIRYGQEIGMGENLSLPERGAVRTPMQWSDDLHGGFSRASAEDLRKLVVSEGPYRYEKVNVVKQRQDPESFLNWMERMIRMRKECPEFGWGECTVMEVENPAVFAHRCHWQDGDVLAIHNLTDEPQTVQFAMSELAGDHVIDLLANRRYQSVDDIHQEIELDGYGYRWFRLRGNYT